MEQKTHYQILGISPKSTQDDIKKAYYKLMKENHPDKYNTVEKLEEVRHQVKIINKAYEILRNDKLKKEYDNSLKIGQKTDNFTSAKSSFQKYMESINVDETQKNKLKKAAEKQFKQRFNEIDEQKGIDRQQELHKFTKEELEFEYTQLETTRDQENIEYMPEVINAETIDGKFDIQRFNDEFEKIEEDTVALIHYQEETQPYQQENYNDYAPIEDNNQQLLFDTTKVEKLITPDMKKHITHHVEQKITDDDVEALIKQRTEETLKLNKIIPVEYIDVCGHKDKIENISYEDNNGSAFELTEKTIAQLRRKK